MDLSPDAVRTARFRTGFRGWDPGEVQALLGAVADHLADLNARVEAAEARAAAVEAEAHQRRAEVEAEAGRIVGDARSEADRILAEARAEAQRIVADAWAEAEQVRQAAQAEAERLLADARARAADLVADAERQAADRVAAAVGEAAAAAAAERDAHRSELATLAEQAVRGRATVARLDRHIDEQEAHLAYLDEELAAVRGRLEAVAAAVARLLDDTLDGLPDLADAPPEGEPAGPAAGDAGGSGDGEDDGDVAGELAALAHGDPASTFFTEATLVDDRFLSRRERRRLRRERPAPLGSDTAPDGDPPGGS